MQSYTFREPPTNTIEIGGKVYAARLGDLSFSVRAKEAAEKMAAIAEEGLSQGEVLERVDRFADYVLELCASVFGRDAAEELVGGEHRLDLYRIADVVGIIADVMTSEESQRAAADAFGGR